MTQDNADRVSDEMEFFHSHFLQRAHVTDDTIYLSDLAKFEQLISKVKTLEAEIQKVIKELKAILRSKELKEEEIFLEWLTERLSPKIKKLEALAVVNKKK